MWWTAQIKLILLNLIIFLNVSDFLCKNSLKIIKEEILSISYVVLYFISYNYVLKEIKNTSLINVDRDIELRFTFPASLDVSLTLQILTRCDSSLENVWTRQCQL